MTHLPERAAHVAGRVSGAVEAHGVGGTAAILARRVRHAAYVDEVSTWFEARLDATRPRVELTEGELRPATDEPTFALFNAIGSQPGPVARARRAMGGEPWVLVVEGRPAFGCWIYARRSPINSMPGEWLALPPGVRTLEDSVTAPEFRGRGLAAGVWTVLFDGLEQAGVTSVVTNVLDTNVPSTRAVAKVGFAAVASMRYVRVGPVARQHLTVVGGSDVGRVLAADLHHRTYVRGI